MVDLTDTPAYPINSTQRLGFNFVLLTPYFVSCYSFSLKHDMGNDVTESVIEKKLSQNVGIPQYFDETNPLFARVMGMTNLAVAIFDQELNLKFYNNKALEFFEIENTDFDKNYSFNEIAKTFLSDDTTEILGPLQVQGFIEDNIDGAAHTTNEVKLTTRKGLRLHIKRKSLDGLNIITAQDITENYIRNQTLSIALETGQAGYFHYNLKTKKYKIQSDYLRKQLTEKQMKKADEDGFLSIIHPADKNGTLQAWNNAKSTGLATEKVCRIMTGKGRNIWMRWHFKPQYSSKGKLIGYNCFFKDISKALEIRDALRQSKEDAERALKIKNDFLARLAHEIRTPMNGVIGIADALIHHNSDPVINPKLELIQSSADKILRIVDETLSHTKLHADKLTLDSNPASPGKSVEDVINLWEQKALQNNINLTSVISPDVPEEIIFDKFRYEQCINNLISNAVKFTPNGSIKVILTTTQKENEKPQLIFAVQDDGIGMTDDQQSQIFEAYTQADKSISGRFGGTGLGMTITKEIIELMGGSIYVRSKLGHGSIFVLSLPYSVDEAESFEEDYNELVDKILEEAKPEETNYSGLRVLVVDDNSTNHVVVTSLIESLVAEVHLASNGQEAIDLLKTTEIDVVLMDIHMPVMDGIEATLSIRASTETWSDVPIIALTADPEYQQKRLCKNIGMNDALTKPVKLSDILHSFDNVMTNTRQDDVAA